MFSTNSDTENGHDPFSFPPDHSFHLPISFFPFPSPFEIDQFDEYDFMFHQPHNLTSNSQNNAPITTPTLDKIPTNTNKNTNMAIINSNQKKKIPRKRLSKKDRHSKITTARGLRDRRMRLSQPVARQFFGLQDMLGVDRGSKTVEWLLNQARPEILKLAKERNCSLVMSSFKSWAATVCSNSNSEGDMVSGIDEVGVGEPVDHHEENGEIFGKKMKSLKSDSKKKKRVKEPRKTRAKELRQMARARARARTMEKKNQIRDCSVSDFNHNHHHHQNCTNNNNFNKISSCSWSSPFETEEESGGTHSDNLKPAIEVEKPMTSQFVSSPPIIDYHLQNFSSFEIMAKWSPSDSTFNYLHQVENLDLQENGFEDTDIFG